MFGVGSDVYPIQNLLLILTVKCLTIHIRFLPSLNVLCITPVNVLFCISFEPIIVLDLL